MKLITYQQIREMQIAPTTWVTWIRESFAAKRNAQLPPKISLKPRAGDFFNTMPCLLPPTFGRFGLKVVHRIAGATPSLGSQILLYDAEHGGLMAVVDGDLVTTMRTGAVAALAIMTFRRTAHDLCYSMVGLGNTARATMLCLLESEPDVMHHVLLRRYKNQAEQFAERFQDYTNVDFSFTDDNRELVAQADVVVSCVTFAPTPLCPDTSLFREGCTVVPVHTRGFENCDTVFDKVFGDDTGHLCDFRYFSQFRHFAEMGDVLSGDTPGRESSHERILCYNVGLGLHDVYTANKICSLLGDKATEVSMPKEHRKFYI